MKDEMLDQIASIQSRKVTEGNKFQRGYGESDKRKVLELIRDNPDESITELAELLEVKPSAISCWNARLKVYAAKRSQSKREALNKSFKSLQSMSVADLEGIIKQQEEQIKHAKLMRIIELNRTTLEGLTA